MKCPAGRSPTRNDMFNAVVDLGWFVRITRLNEYGTVVIDRNTPAVKSGLLAFYLL